MLPYINFHSTVLVVMELFEIGPTLEQLPVNRHNWPMDTCG